MTITPNGVALRPETQLIPVQEVSMKFGITEQKVETLMQKYQLDSTMLADALEINLEFKGSLFKACELIRSNGGDVDVVRDIYEICGELDGASLVSVSLLLQRFEGESPERVIAMINEAHLYSRRKWLASTALDLLHIAQSNDAILFMDQLVEEMKQLKAV